MKHFNSIFAAYLIGWSIFFLFFVSVAKRSSDLRAEVERLKRSLGKEK